jgi:hypothetical protein
MKKIVITLSILITSITSFSQTITYKDLFFIINNQDIEKIDTLLNNRGLNIMEVKNISDTLKCGSIMWNYPNKEKKLDNFHQVIKSCINDSLQVVYIYSKPENYSEIKNEIIISGFQKKRENFKNNMLNMFYVKGKYTIQIGKGTIGKERNITPVFVFSVMKKIEK